jgi:hypothetical protein
LKTNQAGEGLHLSRRQLDLIDLIYTNKGQYKQIGFELVLNIPKRAKGKG